MDPYVKADEGGVNIKIRVNPNSSKDMVTGIREDELCIKISAPAVDGKANAALSKYIASLFDIRKRKVRIISGEKSSRKMIKLEGLKEGFVRERIKKLTV